MNRLPSPLVIFLCLLLLPWPVTTNADERIIELPSGDELTVEVFPATTATVAGTVVWAPSEHGIQPGEKKTIEALAALLAPAGFELWLPDYFSSFFLPPGSQSLEQAAAPSLLALLEKLRTRSRNDVAHPVFLIAGNKAAIAALDALHRFQQEHGAVKRIGLILLNPDVNVSTPRPGETARYRPVVHRSNAPIYILQAEKSPWRLSLFSLSEALGRGGSDVFLQLLRGVRDRFWFRSDATDAEDEAGAKLPAIIAIAMQRLSAYMDEPRSTVVAAPTEQEPVEEQKRLRGLTQYHGRQGIGLRLPDLTGQPHDLTQWRGKVILLNFWASWCPPCVHEIPSMVALKNALKDKPFEIVAVNLGETREEIDAFLQRHPVNFPILRDESGETAKRWRVSAYPTSFIIDSEGVIRYGLAGGHDWQTPETVETIRTLIE